MPPAANRKPPIPATVIPGSKKPQAKAKQSLLLAKNNNGNI